MIESIYKLLESVGFTHPLHPAFTHIPMGMIMGGVIFTAYSIIRKDPDFMKTAYYCYVVAFLGVFPTILFGIMDWQHRYEGEWSFLIQLKLILAVVLVIILGAILKYGKDYEENSKLVYALYGASLVVAIGLGFSGGELIFG